MNRASLNLLIGGEAGQGLVTLGQLLSKSLVRSGYSIVVSQSYQSRIRGGHNTYAIRMAEEEIQAPQEAVDLLIALNQETIELHASELSPEGLLVADQSLKTRGGRSLNVPFKEMAPGRYFNIAALGVAASLLGLDPERIIQLLQDLFGKKRPQSAEENRQVLSKAFAWCKESRVSFAHLSLAPPGRKRLMLNGNEAIALGALSAGVRFCSFYPMTPSTSIPLTLVAKASETGVIVEQGEDEIAVINMALGASFAGAPSMATTSGGGFALMTEGVSLAAMTETPLVIVVAQRPGPATGLPTRTEQGDLEFVLHSGHGEFPRVLFAPGSIEECFHLTRRAFELAERYQGPMFVLTDQFLADSFRAVVPFDMENLPQVATGAAPDWVAPPYVRFAVTETGISPRLLPGRSKHLVVADSDEHSEDGHITEDLTVRNRMVEKRMRKLQGILGEVVPPTWEGEESADLLLVSWGSTRGSVREAAVRLREQGRLAAALHFSQVWPLVPEQFLERLKSAKEVVAVEGNATGQFARLIRREAGFEIPKRVLRYDGLPITPEFILRELGQ